MPPLGYCHVLSCPLWAIIMRQLTLYSSLPGFILRLTPGVVILPSWLYIILTPGFLAIFQPSWLFTSADSICLFLPMASRRASIQPFNIMASLVKAMPPRIMAHPALVYRLFTAASIQSLFMWHILAYLL